MISAAAKSTAAVALIATLPVMSMTGCESIERRTGISTRTQTGAGIGAAGGGVLAAIAGANPAWIAASTILGGLTGGAVSEYLDRNDVEEHASNQYRSLKTLDEGETSSWSNPETGHSGSTTVTNAFTTANGTKCKQFTEVIETGNRTIQDSGTACRQPNGDWKVRTS